LEVLNDIFCDWIFHVDNQVSEEKVQYK
jgi:hypothetical protein